MKNRLKRLISFLGLTKIAKLVYRFFILIARFPKSTSPVSSRDKPVFSTSGELTRFYTRVNVAFSMIWDDKLEEAEQALDALQEMEPNHPVLAWGQGIILRRQDKPEQAISVLSGWDDERLQAECVAAHDDVRRAQISVFTLKVNTLIAKMDYSGAGEYISANKEQLSPIENANLLMQSLVGCKKKATVHKFLDILCLDFLPRFDDEIDPLLVKLYMAVCQSHNSQNDAARAHVAKFVTKTDADQAYLWSDHIRSVGIYFLSIQMAAECAALFDVLHRSERFEYTAAGRYNHGYSMIAYARLNDVEKIRDHGEKRLHILQSTPSGLLPEIFGSDAVAVSGQLQSGASPIQAAQTLTASLTDKLPPLSKIIDTLDTCLPQIPAMLSFQRTYTINPLCMGSNATSVNKLQDDTACLSAQCETALLIAQQIENTSVPILLRLLQLYLYQGQLEKAGAIRATLDPLIDMSSEPVEVLRFDARAKEDIVSTEDRQRVTLHPFATWLENTGCQDAQVICEQAEKTSDFPFFETAEPSMISYTYTAPELRIGTVENVTCFNMGIAVNDQMQAIADDFQFPECAALPSGTLAASDQYALLRTDRPTWVAPDDCAAFLDMPIFRNEFYHTVAQYLSRLALLQKKGLLDGHALLMPDNLGGGAYAVLDAMGIDRKRLVLAPSGHNVRLNTALMPSPSFEMRKPQRAEMYALRDLILSRHGAGGPQDKKIYISRRNLNNRILTNEPELEAIAQELGYVVVQPETLPFNDQVTLFSQAKVIVGSTGAGLVNMVHAPAGATVVCMTIKDHAIDFWPVMAKDLGHDFAFLAGQSFFPDAPVQVQTFDFRVDPAVFRSVMGAY
jgi:capsular polysaccharide biosynthesis protein